MIVQSNVRREVYIGILQPMWTTANEESLREESFVEVMLVMLPMMKQSLVVRTLYSLFSCVALEQT